MFNKTFNFFFTKLFINNKTNNLFFKIDHYRNRIGNINY